MVYSPSVDVVKVEKLASTTWELLQRQIVLPNLVSNFNGNDFKGALGDTIKIAVPGRAKARDRALRPATEQDRTIIMDNIEESYFTVQLTKDLYSATPLEDEVLTLDIDSTITKVLQPQVRAVSTKVENFIAAEIESANYLPSHDLHVDPHNFHDSLVDADATLSDAFVPEDGRVLIVGTNVWRALKKSPEYKTYNQSGSIATSLLQSATMGEIAGYNPVKVSCIDRDSAYMFHKSAFAFSAVTPAIPEGAAFGKQVGSQAGVSLTWLKDYDFLQSRDRSLVHTYAGCNTFEDQPDVLADNAAVRSGGLLRAVRLTLPAHS